MDGEYYVRSAMDKWDNFTAGNIPLAIDIPGCIGCLLVYESREAFEREHPGEEPLVVRTVGANSHLAN